MDRETKKAFFWTRLSNVPFWVLFNLLPIILYKDLHASSWAIALMVALKPASALLAGYWGAWVHKRQDRLISNLTWAHLLRYLPFFFLPWIASAWWLICAFGLYMMLSRGTIPAWMELFHLHIDKKAQSKTFAYGAAVDYLSTALLPLGLGWVLDDYPMAWRWLFPLSALVALSSLPSLSRLAPQPLSSDIPASTSWKETLLKPWKTAWDLLLKRADFAQFQCGFLWGGAGLMVLQPVLPIFFVDTLQLSYTEMLMAMSLCKSVGFALASPLWVRLLDHTPLQYTCGITILLAALFPLCLLTATWVPLCIYLAYLLYGVMQAGSELCWHLSGPTFAHGEDSSPYSTTNVLAVGVRGCIAPPLGSALLGISQPFWVLLLGSCFCLFSAKTFLQRKTTIYSQNS